MIFSLCYGEWRTCVKADGYQRLSGPITYYVCVWDRPWWKFWAKKQWRAVVDEVGYPHFFAELSEARREAMRMSKEGPYPKSP